MATVKKLGLWSVSAIRHLADEQSFNRGKRYFDDGRVFNCVRTGPQLHARCRGSDPEPYQVDVALSKQGLSSFECSCPRGGFCKHIVAVLLTYVVHPEQFREQPALESMLLALSRDDLAAIIRRWVKRKPDLVAALELAFLEKQGHEDPTAYRRSVRLALQAGDARHIETELSSLLEQAEKRVKQENWPSAGLFYHALLVESVRAYPTRLLEMDEDGDLAILVDEMAQGLIQCLKKGNPSQPKRLQWLDALLDAVLVDFQMGGIDLCPSAEDVLLKNTSPQEWAHIEKRIQTRMADSSGYEREALAGLLSEKKS